MDKFKMWWTDLMRNPNFNIIFEGSNADHKSNEWMTFLQDFSQFSYLEGRKSMVRDIRETNEGIEKCGI